MIVDRNSFFHGSHGRWHIKDCQCILAAFTRSGLQRHGFSQRCLALSVVWKETESSMDDVLFLYPSPAEVCFSFWFVLEHVVLVSSSSSVVSDPFDFSKHPQVVSPFVSALVSRVEAMHLQGSVLAGCLVLLPRHFVLGSVSGHAVLLSQAQSS